MFNKGKLKNIFFSALEYIPEKQGDFLYHHLQNLVGHSLESKIDNSYNTYLQLEKVALEIGIDFQGKEIVELGSGWLPLLPYFFKYMGGSDEIHTYDLNRHYQKKNIIALNKRFIQKFQKRIETIDNTYGLPGGVFYHPNTNISREPLKRADIVFSRFVLEHVNPIAMQEMHLNFIKQLRPEAYVVHFISPSDHRAYDDSSLSLQDFLKYSQEDWDKIQTRFDYHNRWRLPQYLELFKTLGFDLVYLNYDVAKTNSMSYNKYKKIKLHPDFEPYSEEELLAGSIQIILKVNERAKRI